MAKLLLTFNEPPTNMWPTQLFDDKNHLNDWLKENEDKFKNPVITKTKLTFEGGSATIEEKPDDFTNT